MNRAFKLFAACVESMRTAEKEYEMNPTAFNKNVAMSLQNKVDGWLAWINEQQDVETTRDLPAFIANPRRHGYQGVIAGDIMEQLKKTHTPEEIEQFTKMLEEGGAVRASGRGEDGHGARPHS